MNRITINDLRVGINLLNILVSKDTGEIGSYELDGAYGGYKLEMIVNKGGGTREITRSRMTSRELYYVIDGIIESMVTNNIISKKLKKRSK